MSEFEFNNFNVFVGISYGRLILVGRCIELVI